MSGTYVDVHCAYDAKHEVYFTPGLMGAHFVDLRYRLHMLLIFGHLITTQLMRCPAMLYDNRKPVSLTRYQIKIDQLLLRIILELPSEK